MYQPAAVASLAIGLAALLLGQPGSRPTVVPAYEDLRRFAEAVERSPGLRATLHRELIGAPRPRECGPGLGSFVPLSADLSAAEAVAILRDIETARVRQTVEAALAAASTMLPGAAPIVCLQAVGKNRAIELLHGVGGASFGGRIKIFLHPTEHKFAKLAYTAAHEYHHEVARRWLQPGWTADPLEAMIAEGKADAFAVRLYPRLRPAHTDPLSADEWRAAWAMFQKSRAQPAPAFRQEFMFGLAPGMPRWAGYRLGFQIVQAYLATRPELPPAAWTAIPAAEVLAAYERRRNP